MSAIQYTIQYVTPLFTSNCRFWAIQERAHLLNVNGKLAVDQNMPDFNDNPHVHKLHNIFAFLSKKPMIEIDRKLKNEN